MIDKNKLFLELEKARMFLKKGVIYKTDVLSIDHIKEIAEDLDNDKKEKRQQIEEKVFFDYKNDKSKC